jgi:predicted enzyme related to lactoylglutathione lyase
MKKGEAVDNHEKISYVEFPAKDLEKTKRFFIDAFGWSFVDYGPEYSCFTNGGLYGGFFKSEMNFSVGKGSPLIVLYSEKLEVTQSHIEKAGGKIVKPMYSFPGGRRFHFTDPNGNEYAVWSE